MAIDFDTNIFPLYASNMEGTTEYANDFAVITGTVGVATAATAVPGWANTDTISINDGSGANVVALSTGTGTPTEIAGDISADAGIIADGIVADVVEIPAGFTVRIRKTVTSANSLTLADGSGTPLADLGLAAGPVTGATGGIPFVKVDANNEKRILTMVEVVRSYMDTLRSRNEVRLWHDCLSRMLSDVAYSDVYDDIRAKAIGNQPNPTFLITQGVSVTTVSGTDASVLAATGDLATTIADINGDLVTATEVEAYNDNNRLAFRNTAGSEGVEFTLSLPVNGFDATAGLAMGLYQGPVVEVGNAARVQATTVFTTRKRADVL